MMTKCTQTLMMPFLYSITLNVILWPWILSSLHARPLASTELSGDKLSLKVPQDLKAHIKHALRLRGFRGKQGLTKASELTYVAIVPRIATLGLATIATVDAAK